jgi:hypothetical protein
VAPHLSHLWTVERSEVDPWRGGCAQGGRDDGVRRRQAVQGRAQGAHWGRKGPGGADDGGVPHHATHWRAMGVGHAHRPLGICGDESNRQG